MTSKAYVKFGLFIFYLKFTQYYGFTYVFLHGKNSDYSQLLR